MKDRSPVVPHPEKISKPTNDITEHWIRWPDDWHRKPGKKVGAALALLIMTSMVFVPAPEGLSPAAFRTLLTLLMAMCLWLPEVFPPALSSLLLITILPLTGALTFDDAISGLGNKVIWLLISVSFLTTALHATGLDRRLAYVIIRRSGGSSAGTLLAVIMTGLLFTFIIPNAESRTAMLVSLAVGILQAMGLKPLESNIGRGMLIATSLTALLGSAAVMTGASATIYAASYFDSVLHYNWTYLNWLIFMLPGVFVTCLILWVIILRVFPPETKQIQGGLQFVKDELQAMGPMNIAERKLIAIWGVLFALLFFGEYIGVDRVMAFMIVGMALFMPGIALIDWPGASRRVPWGTLIFFAASLTLSKAVVSSGAADWLAIQLVRVVSGFPSWLITIGVMMLFVILRFVFTNMTSVLITLMPVVVSLAVSTGRNPVSLGMIAVISSALCLFTPMQSASNFTAYSTGYYEVADLAKVGALATIGVVLVTLTVAYLYWPLLGLHP